MRPIDGAMTENLQDWLSGIGLGKQAKTFADNGIDWDVLLELTESDLRELGLSLGDRKRLLKAITGLKRDEPAADAAEPQRTPTEVAVPAPSAIAKAATKTEAERRQITVMFVDLVGSTPMSEKLDPEDMREVLRAFHEGCAKAIETERKPMSRNALARIWVAEGASAAAAVTDVR